jgi:G3E family GTPase
MLQPIIQAVPTHIITGFLGAGKTTLLNALLQQKPAGETWAVLMNEFGRIGVDQALISERDGIAIKEVLGGCLCCTSHLPMQVALARLLSSAKPDRLFIEPTGMGHPDQLIEQLSEAHWQKALSLRAVVTVVNGCALQDNRLTSHDIFSAQVQVADMLLVSNSAAMTDADQHALAALCSRFHKQPQQLHMIEQGQISFSVIDQPRPSANTHRRPLLQSFNQPFAAQSAEVQDDAAIALPYHYVEQASGQEVGGWRLPGDWVFDRNQLLNCLMDEQHWLRIKGILQVEDGWVSLNLVPYTMRFNSHEGFSDNRLEIIGEPGRDWVGLEQRLLACLISTSSQQAKS